MFISFLKSIITDSRSDCSKSECMAATLNFLRFKVKARSFTFCLEEAKISVLCKTGLIPVLFYLVFMVYMVIFWYFVQIYLWLTVDHERELLMTLCGILFLAAGMIPIGNILVLIWLYKQIKRRWLEV